LVYCLVRIFPFWYVLPKKSGNPAKNAKNWTRHMKCGQLTVALRNYSVAPFCVIFLQHFFANFCVIFFAIFGVILRYRRQIKLRCAQVLLIESECWKFLEFFEHIFYEPKLKYLNRVEEKFQHFCWSTAFVVLGKLRTDFLTHGLASHPVLDFFTSSKNCRWRRSTKSQPG
jgi:hypothetical protein